MGKGQELPGGAGDSHRVRLETGEAAQILACSLQDGVYSYLSQVTVGLYPQALAFLPPNPCVLDSLSLAFIHIRGQLHKPPASSMPQPPLNGVS